MLNNQSHKIKLSSFIVLTSYLLGSTFEKVLWVFLFEINKKSLLSSGQLPSILSYFYAGYISKGKILIVTTTLVTNAMLLQCIKIEHFHLNNTKIWFIQRKRIAWKNMHNKKYYLFCMPTINYPIFLLSD